jgi:hypothetical protein
MSEKDIQNLINLAESKLLAGVSPEEALATFVGAGIMDANGNYTAPYKELLHEAGIDA